MTTRVLLAAGLAVAGVLLTGSAGGGKLAAAVAHAGGVGLVGSG